MGIQVINRLGHKVHSIDGLSVIEKSGKRPFKVMVGGRLRAFASIEAAVKASKAGEEKRKEQAKIEMESWRQF